MNTKNVAILVASLTLIGSMAIAGEFLLADHTHSAETTLEHGGGLDQCGGHYNRKTGGYHIHRPGKC